MIRDLRLQHFRTYTDETFEFGDGVNIIVGPNASGKTNLLEAILYISRGNSYRTKNIEEIISFKQNWSRLETGAGDEQRVAKLDARNHPPQKTFNINGKTYKRLPIRQTIPTVLFEPEHLRLLNGRPELRRDFLDDILSQTEPGYSKLSRDYKRVLAQRNSLLKRHKSESQPQLFAWNIRLSELGGQIAGHRTALTQKLNDQINTLYKKLSGTKSKTNVEYTSPWPADSYSTQMLKKLESNIDLDYERGFTGCGPHRDDLLIIIDSHPVQETASRGETRTILLALKIIELKLLEEIREQKPLLLLDDVFSELDGRRRRFLTKFLKQYQTFITTTDADVVIQHFMDECTIIPTLNGRK